MFTTVPKRLMVGLGPNVTIEDLNDILVELHYPAIIFIAVLMVVGVVGNVFILYVYTTKYPQSSYRSFILWLGWIDLVACSVGMPLLIVSMLYPYMFPSEAACKTLRFLHVFLVVSSAFIVVVIALERHRRICKSFSLEITPVRIRMMCSIAYMLGCLVAIPAIFIYGDASVDAGIHNITGIECFIDQDYEHSFLPKGYFMFQLLLTIICVVVIGILYFRIGIEIFKHHQFIRENTYNGQYSCEEKSDKTQKTNSIQIEKDNESNNKGQLKNDHSSNRTKSPNSSPIEDIELLNNPLQDDINNLYTNVRHNGPYVRKHVREIKHTGRRVATAKSTKTDQQNSTSKLMNRQSSQHSSTTKITHVQSDQQETTTKLTNKQVDRHVSKTKLTNNQTDRKVSMTKLENKQVDGRMLTSEQSKNQTDTQESTEMITNIQLDQQDPMIKTFNVQSAPKVSTIKTTNFRADQKETKTEEIGGDINYHDPASNVADGQIDRHEPMTIAINGHPSRQKLTMETTNLQIAQQEAKTKEIDEEIDKHEPAAKVETGPVNGREAKTKQFNKLRKGSENSVNRGPSLRTKRITFMLFMITLVFVLSFIPHLVLILLNAFNASFIQDMTPTEVSVYNVFLRSFVINNMANPIIYGFCDKKFRSECFNCIFRC